MQGDFYEDVYSAYIIVMCAPGWYVDKRKII